MAVTSGIANMPHIWLIDCPLNFAKNSEIFHVTPFISIYTSILSFEVCYSTKLLSQSLNNLHAPATIMIYYTRCHFISFTYRIFIRRWSHRFFSRKKLIRYYVSTLEDEDISHHFFFQLISIIDRRLDPIPLSNVPINALQFQILQSYFFFANSFAFHRPNSPSLRCTSLVWMARGGSSEEQSRVLGSLAIKLWYFSFFGSSSMNSLKTNSDVGGQKGRDLSMFTFVRSCPPIVRSYPPTVRSCTPQNCNFAWTLACPWRHCWKATASSSDLYYRATPITHF